MSKAVNVDSPPTCPELSSRNRAKRPSSAGSALLRGDYIAICSHRALCGWVYQEGCQLGVFALSAVPTQVPGGGPRVAEGRTA